MGIVSNNSNLSAFRASTVQQNVVQKPLSAVIPNSYNPNHSSILDLYTSKNIDTNVDNQLPGGSIYRYTKDSAPAQKIFSSKGYNSSNRYSEYLNSLVDTRSLLSLRSTEKNSPSALDEQYMKFNLRTESYNPSYPAQPFVLRGIQRIGNPEPQLWGVDGIRTEGVLSDTVGTVSTYIDRTVAEISRYSQWVVSPKGIVSLAKFGLFNLISAKNKSDQFAYARNRFTSYHDTYYKNDTDLYSGVAILNDAKNAVSWTKTAGESTINFLKQDGASQTQDIKDFFADKKSEIKSYYTNRSLYRLYNETAGVETENTNPAVAMNRLESAAERSKVDGFNPPIPNNYATIAYSKIPKNKRSERSFNDFRSDINKDVDAKSYVGITDENYYTQNNLENKYGFGNLGQPGQDRSNPNKFIVTGSSWLHGYGAKSDKELRKQLVNKSEFRGDKVTATDIFSKESYSGQRLSVDDFYPAGTTDLIKFWFEDAEFGNNVMIFRATITGLSDSFSPGWDRIETMGRPDGMYVYTSFERSISFEFRVAALSRSEMIPMWRKLNFLATYTMPDYGDVNSSWKHSGPFMRMTLGDLYWRQPGFISSLSYNFPDDTSWDIADDANENDDAKQLPTVVDVSLTYNLISDHRPRLMGRAYSLSKNNTIASGKGQWLTNAFTN